MRRAVEPEEPWRVPLASVLLGGAPFFGALRPVQAAAAVVCLLAVPGSVARW